MTRVEAFSDAVIAIAITLLVVELPFEVVGRGDLLGALAHHWPRFGAYALCFVGLGIMWLHHHAIFRALAHVDRPIVLLNMVLLLAVAFSPFPTSLVGDYLRRGGADARVAVALFSLTWVVVSGTATLMLRHAARHPDLLAHEVSVAGVHRLLRNVALACGAYAVLTGVALLSPEACLACYCVAAVVFLWGSDHRALRAGTVEDRGA
jgi:uncharacterized membrane protein